MHSGGISEAVLLKGDLEVRVFRVGEDFFDFRFSYIAGKILFNVPDAIFYVIRTSLGEHLDGAIRHISDETGQLTATCRSAGGEAEANALDPADESYVFGNHYLFCILEQSGNMNV